jgi:hypothetical protein
MTEHVSVCTGENCSADPLNIRGRKNLLDRFENRRMLSMFYVRLCDVLIMDNEASNVQERGEFS